MKSSLAKHKASTALYVPASCLIHDKYDCYGY